MDELDSLIDSLLEQRQAPAGSLLDERYGDTLALGHIPSKGQGVTAKQLLTVDRPVCSLPYPTMAALDADHLVSTCYYCLVVTEPPLPLPGSGYAAIELKTCNGCHRARFCNRHCQVQGWRSFHKYECKVFKKMHANFPDAIFRAVLRLVLLKDRDLVPGDEWDRLSSLVSHDQLLAGRGRSNLTTMAESIQLVAESRLSVGAIQRLIFIMKFNAIELPTPIQGGIGVMVDPVLARFNHSCEPNVAVYRPQHTMTSGWMDATALSDEQRRSFFHMVPLRDIQPGEEVQTCYIAPTVAVAARQEKLAQDYFFTCQCPRCAADTQAAADLVADHAALVAEFDAWTVDVGRRLAKVGRPGATADALPQAAAAMDRSERFLEYAALYATGRFPELAMTFVAEGTKRRALEIALVNMLRIYFVVNPPRYIGRHNPTNIYTTFLLLDLWDAVLGISAPAGVTDEMVAQFRSRLADRGMSQSSLVYWRHRIGADLRRRLQGSVAQDLLALVEQREQRGEKYATADDSRPDGDVGRQATDVKTTSEREMGRLLRIHDAQWRVMLQDAGC